MTTTVKKIRKPKQTQEEKERIAAAAAEWLKANDKRLWGERVGRKQARKEFGQEISAVAFKSLAVDHCEFYQDEDYRRGRQPTKSVNLLASRWEKIGAAAREHAAVLSATDATIDFCVRYLLWHGVSCSRRVLLNCSAFHVATGRKYQ